MKSVKMKNLTYLQHPLLRSPDHGSTHQQVEETTIHQETTDQTDEMQIEIEAEEDFRGIGIGKEVEHHQDRVTAAPARVVRDQGGIIELLPRGLSWRGNVGLCLLGTSV